MRTRVRGNDAPRVDHLIENQHVSRTLEQLNQIVVSAGQHWGAGVEPYYAALGQVPVLRTGITLSRLCEGGLRLFPLGRERRKFSIRRIHNQGTLPRGDDLCSPVYPELIVCA